MFSIKMIRPNGDFESFPIEVYKDSIYVGGAWQPCASIWIPEEAEAFVRFEHAGEYIRYAFLEGSVTEGDFDDWEDNLVRWQLLIDGRPCDHTEFSTKAFNKLHGVTA